MSAALSLAPRLALARLKNARGGATLDLFAVLAFAVSTMLALTVAGGAWMLHMRRVGYEAMGNLDYLNGAIFEEMLAYFACTLLVVPILSLGGTAARLGARGRERRFAALRLIGMTGGDVVSIALVETLVQAVVGAAVGVAAYVATLPLWGMVSFQGVPIGIGEMVVPWWMGVLVVVAVILLALLSTVLGLQRVRITPLGVAQAHTAPAVKIWGVVVVVVMLVAFFLVMSGINLLTADMVGFAVTLGFLAMLMGGMHLVGPFVLQLVARLFVRTGQVSRLVAMRRIVADPRGAWRNVSAVALVSWIASFVAIMPSDATRGAGTSPFELYGLQDIQTGVGITLGVGLVLSAVSALMTQASGVIDRASEAVAMDRIGLPRASLAWTRRIEVLMPLVVTVGVAIGFGFLVSLPFYSYGLSVKLSGIVTLGAVALIGMVLSALAAEAVAPLQARVLNEQRRRND